MIRYGSVCSGVEAATLAWKPLGWECVFVSEVEPFPCAVLQHRFGATRPIHPLDPAEAVDDADAAERRSWMKQNEKLREDGVIPNEGDFTKIGDKYRGKIDLLVGGTPCQDLSVAGQRAGFEGERSVLAIDFVRLAYQSGCRWFCWENVPGVFSSNGGAISQDYYPCLPDATLECPNKGLVQPDLFAMLDETDSEWHGECWTLNLPEFPDVSRSPFLNEDVVCSLSDILEIGDVPQRYYLSREACLGLLRRAEKRGKQLPALLEEVLKHQAAC